MFKSKDAKTPGKQTNNDKKISLQDQISSSESLKKINDADKKTKLQNVKNNFLISYLKFQIKF